MPTLYYQRLQKESLARLKRDPLAYGSNLRNTRKGRSRPRPLSTKFSMHLILRSSKAKGSWKFTTPANERRINAIISRFAHKHGVTITNFANVHNHLHIHAELQSAQGYKRFIRAVTSAITMAVTGVSRHRPHAGAGRGKFWDLRPFSRLCTTVAARTRLNRYINLNKAERFIGRARAELALARALDLGLPSPYG
jgi:hypothetical protein